MRPLFLQYPVADTTLTAIEVAKSSVEKYMVRQRKPSSPTWKDVLKNHIEDLVSIDFLVVSTVKFRVLFVLVILAHNRRKVVHFNVPCGPPIIPDDTASRVSLAAYIIRASL